MNHFDISFPHIKYLAATGDLAKITYGTYIGNDRDSGLINGVDYKLYTVAYSPNITQKRMIIWAAHNSIDGKTIYHVNLTDFKLK